MPMRSGSEEMNPHVLGNAMVFENSCLSETPIGYCNLIGFHAEYRATILNMVGKYAKFRIRRPWLEPVSRAYL
jgi:hypothetical protein